MRFKLKDSDLEKIKKRYNYLVNGNLEYELKIGHARTIVDIIITHLKRQDEIIKEFNTEKISQKKRFNKRKANNEYAPYEDPIRDSFSGWLSFFEIKGYIPKDLKNSFNFIQKDVSGPIHGDDENDFILPGIVSRLNKIIEWLFELYDKPTDFLKKVEISNNNTTEQVAANNQVDFKDDKPLEIKKDEPKKLINSSLYNWKNLLVATIFLLFIVTLVYLLQDEKSVDVTNSDDNNKMNLVQDSPKQPDSTFTGNPKKDNQDIDSQSNFSKDPSNSREYQGSSELLKEQEFSDSSEGIEKKANEKFNNNFILITAENNSDNLDQLLMNKIIEKHNKDYHFIANNSSSSNNSRFELFVSIEANCKNSKYTEGIKSCRVYLSYRIVDNKNKSIVNTYNYESAGIGPDETSAKQNAIKKLKL